MEERRKNNELILKYIEEIKDNVSNTNKNLERINHILTGNGTPREGLVFKVESHDKHITWWIGLNSIISTALIVACVGGLVAFVFWKVGLKPV